jgi:hypothetical protein|tara:strand:- start:71 stop:421 length:351 start_codon:yes stop_codon:yes gene_type:complete
MIKEKTLPEDFRTLEHFFEWALHSETERTLKRADACQEEILAFRDAMLGRLDDIVEHLDRFKGENIPEAEGNLYAMLLSVAEIATAVEFYQQPAVIDGFDPRRFLPVEDFILRPKF